MKYLGIDYGTKKIGIAISDKCGKIAFPKKIIKLDINIIDAILNIINEENIQKIIIGKSINMDGSDNKLQIYINKFIKKLKENTDKEIELIDERMSSISARSYLYNKGNTAKTRWTGKENKKRREAVDAGAAAIILQRYLDKNKIG